MVAKSTKHFPKTLARRNARKRLNPPPPSWENTACRTTYSNPNLLPNQSSSKSSVLEPPIVPRWPHAFRRPTQNHRPSHPFGARSGLFWICVPVFANQKLIKNQTPQKATQNLKKTAEVRFFIDVGNLVGTQLLSSYFLLKSQVMKNI